jgi:hypothetical protein
VTEVAARNPLSSAIRYWQPRRIGYNGALLTVVLAAYFANLPASRASLNAGTVQVLFVLANIAYCAAHVVDVVVQLSTFRVRWLRAHWMLLGGRCDFRCSVSGILLARTQCAYRSAGARLHIVGRARTSVSAHGDAADC